MRARRMENAATNSTHELFSVASVLSVSSVFPLEQHQGSLPDSPYASSRTTRGTISRGSMVTGR